MARRKPALETSLGLPADYAELLESLKARVQQAQIKAMLSVNRGLIQLYWDIGREIVGRQEQTTWGQGVLDRLADDLQKSLPGVSGFSRSNVFRMRACYVAYRPAEAGRETVAQPVRQTRRARFRNRLCRNQRHGPYRTHLGPQPEPPSHLECSPRGTTAQFAVLKCPTVGRRAFLAARPYCAMPYSQALSTFALMG
jgi:hypothetical protein